jgi:hypothetical protein
MRAGWWVLFLAGMGACAGCADKDSPVKVSGKVTLDGRPVAGAVVTFVPEQGLGRSAVAWTADDGTFQLSTFRGEDGALRGTYKILVAKTEGSPAGGRGTPAAAASSGPRPKVGLPEVYGDIATTPFRCTVPTGGPVMLELKSKGGP